MVSHCDVDHFGGLADATDAFPNAVTVAHRADADQIDDFDVFLDQRARGFRAEHDVDETAEGLAWLRSVTRPAAVRQRVVGGEQLRLGDDWTVDILHVPGHSHGHLALWDPRSRAAVVSDAVLSDAVRTAEGEAAFPPTYRHVAPYRATIGSTAQRLDPALAAHRPLSDDGRRRGARLPRLQRAVHRSARGRRAHGAHRAGARAPRHPPRDQPARR